MPWINITTMAVKSPTTLMHLHCVIADLKKEVKESDVLAAWDDVSRVRLVSGKRGLMPESLMNVLDSLGLELVVQRRDKGRL